MSTTPAKFDFTKLTIGEAAKCEDLSGQRVAGLEEASDASTLLLAAFAFVWKKRTVPETTWNEILGTEYGDLLAILGMEDDEDEEPAVTFDGSALPGGAEDGEAGPFPHPDGSES